VNFDSTGMKIYTEIGLSNSSDDTNLKKNALVLISTNVKLQGKAYTEFEQLNAARNPLESYFLYILVNNILTKISDLAYKVSLQL